jgi:hypothetical protein
MYGTADFENAPEIIFVCGQITLWAISRDILRAQGFFDP